jgi:bifunctional N-acetylglucosamine-1-phosphate-uridyltransferase/glucosamine-1-phosphate-acetyltransferase GlmU-like protein
MHRVLIIPAAGRGVRLQSPLPKILVPVNGRPMLRHLLDLHAAYVERVVVVAHPSASDSVRACAAHSPLPVDVVTQDTPTGMLDAILIGAAAAERPGFDADRGQPPAGSSGGQSPHAARSSRDADGGQSPVRSEGGRSPHTTRPSRVWITWGDQVAVHPDTLARLATVEPGSDIALPTVERPNPYIHLARDADGRVVEVLQKREGDRMPATGESDVGVFSLSAAACFERLPLYAREARPGAGTGERNFLPFIAWMSASGVIATCPCTDPREAIGVNTPDELAAASAYLAAR